MKTKLIRIGNSRGVRIPKSLLLQTRLGEEFEMIAVQDEIVLRPSRRPREGWEEKFIAMSLHGDDGLLDNAAAVATDFDRNEWAW